MNDPKAGHYVFNTPTRLESGKLEKIFEEIDAQRLNGVCGFGIPLSEIDPDWDREHRCSEPIEVSHPTP